VGLLAKCSKVSLQVVSFCLVYPSWLAVITSSEK
jgi:hypothetical protein